MTNLKGISLSLLSLILSTISPYSMACNLSGTEGIVPENKLYIPAGLKAVGKGVSELQFNNVIDRLTLIYSPIVKKKGGNLIVVKNWQDGTVNAYAHREGKNWYVSMFGGLARHPDIDQDAFATVVCHELGHQIGGAPKKVDPKAGSIWASNEGQADYFATLKCLRNLFKADRNSEIVKKLKVDPRLKSACQSQFHSEEEIAICIRTSVAGLKLGNFFKTLSGGKTAVSISTPDKKIVAITYDSHPDSQCRVDTYFQGSLCDKSLSEDVSNSDENIGTCTKRNGDNIGIRPRCWHKPAI